MQAVVGGNSLDNGSTRYCHGEIVDSIAPDGVRTITVPFVVEGSTADNLATLIGTTITDFCKRNVTCTVKLDSGGSSNYASVAPADGRHLNVVTSIVSDATVKKTATSVGLLLVIVAEVVNALPTTEITGVSEAGLDSFEVSLRYNAGRIVSRTVSGSFVDTGSGSTGESHYNAARSSILTNHLLTGSSGEYDATSKMVLVGEVIENDDGDSRRWNFLLESVYQRIPLTSTTEARGLAGFTVQTYEPDEWDERAGTRPTFVSVQGRAFISNSAWASGVHQIWAQKLRADVLAGLATETGLADFTVKQERISSDPQECAISFDCLYCVNQPVVYEYRRTDQIHDAIDQAIAASSDGSHYVQVSPASPDRQRIITVQRFGQGIADLAPEDPTATIDGRKCWYVDADHSQEGPITTPAGSGFYRQSLTVRFLELAVKDTEPPRPPQFTRSGL